MNVVQPVVIDRPACLNCGTTLIGEFCHGCGQAAGEVDRKWIVAAADHQRR